MGSESIVNEPEWAIDSGAMRAREIISFSKVQLVGQKYRNAIQPPLFWFSKPALFATCGL